MRDDFADQQQLQQLEALIRDTAGNARKTRLLAERVLHELALRSQAFQRQDQRSSGQATSDADAEPAWRRAA